MIYTSSEVALKSEVRAVDGIILHVISWNSEINLLSLTNLRSVTLSRSKCSHKIFLGQCHPSSQQEYVSQDSVSETEESDM